MAAAATRDIRVSLPLKASPRRAYRALTSARELCLWWVDRAETDARNLGEFRLVWPQSLGGAEAEGVFVDLEPDAKVAWLLNGRSKARGVPPLVSFFLEKRPSGCLVTLVHAGFPRPKGGKDLYSAYREGWEDCLAKLALYLGRGRTCKSRRLTLAMAPGSRAAA